MTANVPGISYVNPLWRSHGTGCYDLYITGEESFDAAVDAYEDPWAFEDEVKGEIYGND